MWMSRAIGPQIGIVVPLRVYLWTKLRFLKAGRNFACLYSPKIVKEGNLAS